jgi:hypothetical protein
MMDVQLSLEELDVILESLQYSKQRIEDYDKHPSYEFKRSQLERIERTVERVRALRNSLRQQS